MGDLYAATHEVVSLAVLDGADTVWLEQLSGRSGAAGSVARRRAAARTRDRRGQGAARVRSRHRRLSSGSSDTVRARSPTPTRCAKNSRIRRARHRDQPRGVAGGRRSASPPRCGVTAVIVAALAIAVARRSKLEPRGDGAGRPHRRDVVRASAFAMMSGVTVEDASFSPDLFAFLRDLAANNDREWFTANKPRYVEHVQEPALAFIEDVGMRLRRGQPPLRRRPPPQRRLAVPHLPRRPLRQGQVAVQDQHRHPVPPRPVPRRPRPRLLPEPRARTASSWPAASGTRTATPCTPSAPRSPPSPAAGAPSSRSPRSPTHFRLGGEALKRPPAGFDKDHELIEDLKRKDFIAYTDLDRGRRHRRRVPRPLRRVCAATRARSCASSATARACSTERIGASPGRDRRVRARWQTRS